MINVNKSYIFAWFLFSIILAQTSVIFKGIHARGIILKSETNEGGHDINSANNNDNSEHPSLSCALFHAKGCLVECTVKGIAFLQTAIGECSKNDFCQCIILDDTSYDTLWLNKFGHESEDIRDEIRKNNELYEKVLAIIKKPFTTGNQTKLELKQFLTESQYTRLEVTEDTFASWMLENNELDLKFIRQFVHVLLPLILKPYRKILTHVKYDGQLLEAIDHHHGEHFTRLARDIRRTENKELIHILEQYLEENDRKQEAVQEDAEISLPDTLEYRIIDELIENINSTRYDIDGGNISDSSEDEDE